MRPVFISCLQNRLTAYTETTKRNTRTFGRDCCTPSDMDKLPESSELHMKIINIVFLTSVSRRKKLHDISLQSGLCLFLAHVQELMWKHNLFLYTSEKNIIRNIYVRRSMRRPRMEYFCLCENVQTFARNMSVLHVCAHVPREYFYPIRMFKYSHGIFMFYTHAQMFPQNISILYACSNIPTEYFCSIRICKTSHGIFMFYAHVQMSPSNISILYECGEVPLEYLNMRIG
jgi:hypothetical protein